jgi:hypothetical protein
MTHIGKFEDIIAWQKARDLVRMLYARWSVSETQSQYEKTTALDFRIQSGEISWWRRGRVELPVQKKVARISYKLSQPLLSHLAFLC